MICCCSLAGTRACENCHRKAEYEYRPNAIAIPYTPVDMGEKRLQEIEAIPIERLLSKKYEIVTDTEAFPVNYVIDKVVDLWEKRK